MSRKLGSCLLALGVAALLMLGYFLPQLVCAWTDRKLAAEVRTIDHADVSLNLAQDEMDVLDRLALFSRLMSGGCTTLPPMEGCHMTQAAVAEAADQARANLGCSRDDADLQVTPWLLVSLETAGESAVFWQCVWGVTGGIVESLWLDDQTGLVMGFELCLPDQLDDLDTLLTEFCQRSYPVDLMLLDAVGPKEHDAILILELDEGSRQYHLPIRREWDWIEFNLDPGELQINSGNGPESSSTSTLAS